MCFIQNFIPDLRSSATVDPLKTQRGTPRSFLIMKNDLFYTNISKKLRLLSDLWVKMFDHSILPKRLSEKKWHSNQLEEELCARACTAIDSVWVKRYFCIRLRAEDTRREEDLKTQPQSICMK